MNKPIDFSYGGDIAVLYKGFLLVGQQPGYGPDEPPKLGHVKAYRSPVYFDGNIATYKSTHFHLVYDMIEEANDTGEFTEEQFTGLEGSGKIVGRMYKSIQEALGTPVYEVLEEPGEYIAEVPRGQPVVGFWEDYKTSRQTVEGFLEKSSDYVTDPRYAPMVGQLREQKKRALQDLLSGATSLTAVATIGEFTVGAVRPGGPFFLFRRGWPEPVPSGTWMGWREPEWGLSEHEWEQLPLVEKARMEVAQQIKYTPGEYYGEWLDTYAPSAADEIWWNRGGYRSSKWALATVYEAEAELQRALL